MDRVVRISDTELGRSEHNMVTWGSADVGSIKVCAYIHST
jgi:hypothetical protein